MLENRAPASSRQVQLGPTKPSRPPTAPSPSRTEAHGSWDLYGGEWILSRTWSFVPQPAGRRKPGNWSPTIWGVRIQVEIRDDIYHASVQRLMAMIRGSSGDGRDGPYRGPQPHLRGSGHDARRIGPGRRPRGHGPEVPNRRSGRNRFPRRRLEPGQGRGGVSEGLRTASIASTLTNAPLRKDLIRPGGTKRESVRRN